MGSPKVGGDGRPVQLPKALPKAPPKVATTPVERERTSGWQATGQQQRRTGATTTAVVTSNTSAPAKKSAFDDPAFETYLDLATHSSARTGNQVTPLFDGVQSFAARKELISSAKESINFQTFIFNSDDTGWELANMLAAKAKEGVKVRVIYDALGSNRADPKMFEMMKQAGVEVRPYGNMLGQFWDINDRWHEKHLIIDGRASIIGGMNIANEYALGGSGKMVFSRGNPKGDHPWRDADVRVEGPAVSDAQAAFLRNWEELGPGVTEYERAALMSPQPLRAANVSARVVQHRPDEEGDRNVELLYLKAVNTAEKSITIENAYFVPPRELREALIAAAKRGVEVRVMTNSRDSNDFAAGTDAARYFYDDMINAGVKIYEKHGGTLHSKTATFDGAYSIVGSANLNGRSKGRDSESVVAVRDDKLAGQLDRRFDTGLPETKAVTKAELEKESFWTNLRQWAFSTLAWTF